jgi:uncharacterized protein (TIGR02246 family)
MSKAGEVLQQFYAAVVNRDLAHSRSYLKDDLVFRGLFETYPNADEYLAALTKLLQVTVRLEVKKIVAEGDDAVVLFELETKAPVAATTLVAEWHQIKDGKISQVQSVFDGRPFAAMFAPSQPDRQDEQAIRALNDIFVKGLLNRDPKLRASVWIEDGTVVPPNAGFCRGRAAIEKHFESEVGSVTDSSKATFTNYRFRFITPDAAFVDTELTLNNVQGPDGRVHPVVPISIVFTAVWQHGAWFIQDERAHFLPMPSEAN